MPSTEKKISHRIRELARQVSVLERSNRELTLFAAVAAHDLRAPLRTVASYGQLLANRLNGRLNEEEVDLLKELTETVNRMQELIEQLLQLTQIKHQTVELTPVDCNRVFQNVLDTLKTELGGAQVSVTRDHLPTVKANWTQVLQLLQNLVANALHHCNSRSIRVHVSAESRDDDWRFSIEDNGVGIDPKDQGRIFEPFKRASTKYEGSGLGLAICKGIVEQTGGRIWVESKSGRGSTFFFTLPRSPSDRSGIA